MVLHFAEVQKRRSWIKPWANRANRLSPEWSGERFQQELQEEVDPFWGNWRPHTPVKVPYNKPSAAYGSNIWFRH